MQSLLLVLIIIGVVVDVFLTLKFNKKIMADLTEITANVANNTSVIESAITLLGNIKAQLDAAGTDPVALKALSDTLAAEDSKLADAIVANTPAQ